MATLVFKNAFLTLGGTAVHTYVESIEFQTEVEALDDTTMGDTTRSSKPGMYSQSLSVTFKQDFASSALDSIINALLGTSFAFELRAENATVTTSNPKWTGNAMIKGYSPISGSVGTLAPTKIDLVPSKGAGSATWTRATA